MPNEIAVTYWYESAPFPVLSFLVIAPLTALIAIIFAKSARFTLLAGLAGTLVTIALSIYLLHVFDTGKPGIQLVEKLGFAGMSYSVGVDGANILFIPLTAVLTFLVLIYTLITRHVNDRLFIGCVVSYEAILIGAFSALNVLQFWFWCVLELAPVILLSLHAGTGQNRRWVVLSFFQYWGGYLLLILSGFLLLAFGLIDS